MRLDLTEDEKHVLPALLTSAIDEDRYPLSPRVLTLKAILAKLTRAGPPAIAAAQTYEPPSKGRSKRQR